MADIVDIIAAREVPRILIPTRFWMFVAQNDDPGRFFHLCSELARQSTAMSMRPSEELLFERAS